MIRGPEGGLARQRDHRGVLRLQVSTCKPVSAHGNTAAPWSRETAHAIVDRRRHVASRARARRGVVRIEEQRAVSAIIESLDVKFHVGQRVEHRALESKLGDHVVLDCARDAHGGRLRDEIGRETRGTRKIVGQRVEVSTQKARARAKRAKPSLNPMQLSRAMARWRERVEVHGGDEAWDSSNFNLHDEGSLATEACLRGAQLVEPAGQALDGGVGLRALAAQQPAVQLAAVRLRVAAVAVLAVLEVQVALDLVQVRADLLELDLSQEDALGRLVRFLEIPDVGNAAFPHLNRTR